MVHQIVDQIHFTSKSSCCPDSCLLCYRHVKISTVAQWTAGRRRVVRLGGSFARCGEIAQPMHYSCCILSLLVPCFEAYSFSCHHKSRGGTPSPRPVIRRRFWGSTTLLVRDRLLSRVYAGRYDDIACVGFVWYFV